MNLSRYGSLSALVFVLFAGCGGTVVGGGGDGGGGGSGGSGGSPGSDSGNPGSDSSSDAPVPGTDSSVPPGGFCPSTLPTSDAACSPVGLVCEYGSNPNSQCDMLYGCTSSGWSDETTKSACPTTECPASYASVSGPSQDHPCTVNGAECSYPTQGTCLCTSDPGGLPTTGGPLWECTAATAMCPSPRPRLGSACSTEGASCDYGACTGGIEIVCKGGYWLRDEMVACPG
jgi:hypothetical protein